MIFEHWGEFYLLAGSAAAVLIGLIFVVVTLMSDRPRSSVMMGSRLYMGPVVLNVSFTLVLSAAALVKGMTPGAFAVISGAVAVWGLVRSVLVIAGIRGLSEEDAAHWTDVWFYGVIPALLYAVLAAVAGAFWSEAGWAVYGVAAVIMALLLVTIRNEWDLVTWLVPKPDGGAEE
jgi:lysylphosphatidylglycerol synthetase-like protein (DUF2156 family)